MDQFSPAVLQINSPRSLEAIRSQGFEVSDLVYAKPAGVGKEVGEMRVKRWKRRWEQVKQARKSMIEKRIVGNDDQTAQSALLTESIVHSIASLRAKELQRLGRLHAARQRLLPLPAPPCLHPSSKLIPTSLRSIQSKRKDNPQGKPQAATPEPQSTIAFEMVNKPELTVELSDSLPATIRRVRRLIAAREEEKRLALQSATPSEYSVSPQPTAMLSLNSSAEVTSVSCDPEERERRHTRLLQSLDLSREAKLQEKRHIWSLKLSKFKAVQAEQIKLSDSLRFEQDLKHIQAQSRHEANFTQKETRIQQVLALDSHRQQQSRLRRANFEDKNSQKAAKIEENMREIEKKTQERREFVLNQTRNRLKIRENQRKQRSIDAAQLQKAREERQHHTLEQITAKVALYQQHQSLQHHELLAKQRLRKELELEKWELSEGLERQRVQRQRSMRKEGLKGWYSVSPSPSLLRRQAGSTTPSQVPS